LNLAKPRRRVRTMSYSDYWRVNKSVIDYVELANALQALRKVTAVLNVDAEVVWAGMPCSSDRRIELPAALIQGQYPIPGEKMDVLVGLNMHEALHFLEDSQHAWGYLSHSFLGMEDKTVLAKLAEAGEDIHVDGVAVRKGLPGEYVRKSRAWWKSKYQRDFTEEVANPEGLFGIWTYLVLDVIFPQIGSLGMEQLGQLSGECVEGAGCEALVEALCCGRSMPMLEAYSVLISMSKAYMEPLQMLLEKTPAIINADAVDRGLCYRELWPGLEGHFSAWEARRKASDALLELVESPPGMLDEGGLPTELAEAVQVAIASGAEDVTEGIKVALKAMDVVHEGQYLYPAVFELIDHFPSKKILFTNRLHPLHVISTGDW